MSPSANSTTTLVLLDRLRSGGTPEDWDALDRRYRRVVFGVAHRLGLIAEDAEDVTQQTMLEFFAGWRRGDYDPARGRLRSWLITIVKHRCIDLLRRPDVRKRREGESAASTAIDESSVESAWDLEWRRGILTEAVARFRASPRTSPKVLEAFERCAVRGVPRAEAAKELGVSVDEIYRLKSDALQQIRSIIEQIEIAWDG